MPAGEELAVGLVCRPREQRDEASPVLTKHVERADVVEASHECLHPFDVLVVGVDASIDGRVGTAESDEVGHDDAVAGLDQRRDHETVEVTPGWLAVREQHGASVAEALVDVGHSEPVDVDVSGFIGEVVDSGEPVLGCAEKIDADGGWSWWPWLKVSHPIGMLVVMIYWPGSLDGFLRELTTENPCPGKGPRVIGSIGGECS